MWRDQRGGVKLAMFLVLNLLSGVVFFANPLGLRDQMAVKTGQIMGDILVKTSEGMIDAVADKAPSASEILGKLMGGSSTESDLVSAVLGESASEEGLVSALITNAGVDQTMMSTMMASMGPGPDAILTTLANSSPQQAMVRTVVASAPSQDAAVQTLVASGPSVAEAAQTIAASAPVQHAVIQTVLAQAPSLEEAVLTLLASEPAAAEVVQAMMNSGMAKDEAVSLLLASAPSSQEAMATAVVFGAAREEVMRTAVALALAGGDEPEKKAEGDSGSTFWPQFLKAEYWVKQLEAQPMRPGQGTAAASQGNATPVPTSTRPPEGRVASPQETPSPATPALAPILPLLVNVKQNANGTYTAHFGYENKNTHTVTIPVGPDNFFSPDPVNRNQLTVFQPGGPTDYGPNTFQVVFQGGILQWTVLGHTTTAAVFD